MHGCAIVPEVVLCSHLYEIQIDRISCHAIVRVQAQLIDQAVHRRTVIETTLLAGQIGIGHFIRCHGKRIAEDQNAIRRERHLTAATGRSGLGYV